jgi:hypothetical protein
MKKIDLGVFGLAVATNVRRYRGDTSYAELSRRLTEIGRPIPPLGLRHIEAGNRRVDVDDLVALGVALDIAPLALLTLGLEYGYTAHEAYHYSSVDRRVGAPSKGDESRWRSCSNLWRVGPLR